MADLTEEQQRAFDHERKLIRRQANRHAREAAMQGDPQARLDLRDRFLPILRRPDDHRPMPHDPLV